MRPPAALARAQRETNDARQRVAVLSRARPQNHDTPSVAAALRQKLQSLQTSYATKAEDIASRAPRRPAENVIRILERHERSSKVRGAFHRIKTRMFQERAVEKEAARRATRDAQLALERKRVLQRARELDAMSDGLEALRDLAHRKRRERFAEIACDTRRAFAFFAAMRPRLARRKLERRASGIAALLRVRSCFRTLRAQARRGKIVREISRSANRRHARRARLLRPRLRRVGAHAAQPAVDHDAPLHVRLRRRVPPAHLRALVPPRRRGGRHAAPARPDAPVPGGPRRVPARASAAGTSPGETAAHEALPRLSRGAPAPRAPAGVAPDNEYLEQTSIHVHVPEGATPKDGPSAGITMVTAMLSLALDKSPRADLAMTGELSLTGRVLPIGGVKEKTIAAQRAGIRHIVFPKQNKRDYDELAENLRTGITAHFAERYDEVYQIAFGEVEGEAAA